MSSTQQPDPYAVLGVHPAATSAQITHAYRTLLRRHHPDTRPSATPDTASPDTASTDEVRLEQVLAAYAVLRDPARRADYDRSRAPRTPPAPGPAPDTGDGDIVVLGTLNPTTGPAWIIPLDPSTTSPTRPSNWIRAVLDAER